MNRSRVITEHEEIRTWAEERGGKPAAVKGTGGEDDVGMIRIDFPGYSGEGKLEPISWDAWFAKFDESELALIVQVETADGEQSNFNKLVSREAEVAADGKKGTRSKRRTARTRTAGSRASSRTHARREKPGRKGATRSTARKGRATSARKGHAASARKGVSKTGGRRGSTTTRKRSAKGQNARSRRQR